MSRWLPEPLDERGCDVADRYRRFRFDFIENPPTVFAPRTFRIDSTLVDGREKSFLKLTTTGDPDYIHDPYRCSRIHWGKVIINESGVESSPRVISWCTKQNGEKRIKIAPTNFSYLIILAVRERSVRLVTGFYPHNKHERVKLDKECRRAIRDAAIDVEFKLEFPAK